MRICFLLADISHTGGIERVTSTLAAQMQKDCKDIEIEVVSQFRSSEKLWYPFDGCKITYLTQRDFDAKPHSLDRAKRLLGNLKHIRRHFRNNSYDIIIGQSLSSVLMLFLAGISLHNVLAVEHIHYNYYGSLIKAFRLFVYRKALRVVVLTNNAKSFFDKHLPSEHTVVIPNPIDIATCAQAPLTGTEAIAIGRLQHQKGFDTLIDVFAKVHLRHPEWAVNIYGDGNLHDELARQITEKGMDGIVNLKGRSDNILANIQQSSFFILSSRCEGFGMVLVEAMSQGVPAVAFDCPDGPSDIIEPGRNGILVANQDQEALAEAICHMIEHPNERKEMGKHALETVSRYSAQAICRQWFDLFNSLLPRA